MTACTRPPRVLHTKLYLPMRIVHLLGACVGIATAITCPNFKFCARYIRGHGSVIWFFPDNAADTLCTSASGFADDVIFAHDGQEYAQCEKVV